MIKHRHFFSPPPYKDKQRKTQGGRVLVWNIRSASPTENKTLLFIR